ncbi:MAG TPA: response regulator [Candidatus Paceibacterota bacterium]|nr:response regulator [Verrucomicrobiota bacterium]HRY51019.1 response regulator [Candidatus Paceibacterota bacterium]
MRESKGLLLVEDNPNDAELIVKVLVKHNRTEDIVVVRDGVEALEYLCRQGRYSDRPSENPAVILMDIKMPKVDGLNVLRQIKTDPELRLIPVVMLTSSRQENDLANAYKLGANAYVVKPVDFQTFQNTINSLSLFWGEINEAPPSYVRRNPGA